MARPRKDPSRRVDDRDRGPRPELRLIEGVEPPEPPAGLLKATTRVWESFWRSEQSQLVSGAMVDVVVRWVRLRDEWERIDRAMRKHMTVEGSQGQPVAHPLTGRKSSIEKELRQLEDRLGLTPKAAVNLGLGLGQMRKTLDDLNRDLEVDLDSDLGSLGGGVD